VQDFGSILKTDPCVFKNWDIIRSGTYDLPQGLECTQCTCADALTLGAGETQRIFCHVAGRRGEVAWAVARGAVGDGGCGGTEGEVCVCGGCVSFNTCSMRLERR
jgi:hypothetical protein